MNPFVSDRFCSGEASWPAFHRPILENLERMARMAGDSRSERGQVIQLRSRRAGMGKSHLAGRLTELLGADFAVQQVDLRPENLRSWERSWDRGVQLAGEGFRPRLLVVDHLDAFHGNPAAGMRIARFVERFSEACPGGVLLLLLNQDLWRSLFSSHLPGAFRDLLTWELLELPPALTADEAEGLVIHRMEGAGLEDHVILQFLERLDLGQTFKMPDCKGLSPREIFRRARKAWLTFAGEQEVRRTTVPFAASLTGTEGFLPAPRAEAWPMADQARRHLHAVAEALRGQAGPRPVLQPKSPAGMLRLLELPIAPPPSPPTQPPDVPQPAAEVRAEPLTLAELFQQARLRFLDRQPLDYQAERMFGLLRRIGERFPSIRQTVLNPESPVEERILDWTWFSRRIGIVVAPLEATGTWEKAKRIWKGVAHEGASAKLVGFAPSGELPEAAAGGEPEIIELAPDLLASLYAAEELLRLAPSWGPQLSELRMTGFVASELDFFWARLTRPLGGRSAVRELAEQGVAT